MNPAVRRAYEEPEPPDGTRVLVDRRWPRGLIRDRAGLDDWLRDVAPSDELRRWYGHDPSRLAEFADRCRAELSDAAHAEAPARPRGHLRAGPVTLLTATRDLNLSHAAVVASFLQTGGGRSAAGG
jgi:uncharacterized protein YeaO (DUF488 family)